MQGNSRTGIYLADYLGRLSEELWCGRSTVEKIVRDLRLFEDREHMLVDICGTRQLSRAVSRPDGISY